MESLVKKYSGVLPEKLITDITDNVPKGTSKDKLEIIFERVYSEYKSSLAEPGESVGIVTAESIGEPSTQMTLDTFHLAGVSEVNVTTGLPRLLEILDGRKNISTASMEIFLNKEIKDVSEIKAIASQIRQTSLESFISGIDIDISEVILKVSLDKKELSFANTDAKKIAKFVEKSLRGFKCAAKDDTTLHIKSSKSGNVNDLYKAREQVKNVYVSGVKGITQVVPVKRDGEYVILTRGSNIKEIFKFDFVDQSRTTSNDIFEIEKHLGVEAARELIIREASGVLEEQGIPVDIRHIMLIADAMTMSGHVLGVNRYGIVKEKPSVLARASFETPIRHLISAGLTGEIDELNSVIENVMINQPVPVGTGLPGLVTSGVMNPDGDSPKASPSLKKEATKAEAAETKPSSASKTSSTKKTAKKSSTKSTKKAASKKTTSSKKTTAKKTSSKKSTKKASKKTAKKSAK